MATTNKIDQPLDPFSPTKITLRTAAGMMMMSPAVADVRMVNQSIFGTQPI